jgi:uncharacterized lipoprotein YmbA
MKRLITALVLALSLAACASTNTSAPIVNIQDHAIPAQAQGRDTDGIIVSALVFRGWQVESRAPGRIDAFLAVRVHRAAISITYDQDSYSITYRSSENLGATGSNIHRNYNRWVANLDNDIQVRLAAAS